MEVLPEAFGMLTFLGLWKSDKWSTLIRLLYYCYTLLLIYNIIFFIFCGIMGLIFFATNVIDIIHNSSMIFTTITVFGKLLTVICQRQKIINLVNKLQSANLQVQNFEELQLSEHYRKSIRFYTIAYIAFFESSAITFHALLMLECYEKKLLPYKAWFPYNTSNIYSFTSFQQVITIVIVANMNVTYDTLLLGIIVHICLQINILKRRFQRMLNNLEENSVLQSDMKYKEYEILEKKLITEYVTFQNFILGLVNDLTDIFSRTMFIQFGLSALILCTSIYVLSQTPVFSSEFIGCAVYISCMILDIFFPCLIGNQMTLEFAELNNAMYSTNWYTLSNKFRKYMNLIMIRSSKPIVFSSGYVISLSLEAFKSLIKLSFSIYNVVQKSSYKQ